jgi:hypothetical protein
VTPLTQWRGEVAGTLSTTVSLVSDIVAGTKTLVSTLVGDTFHADLGEDNAISTAYINGLTAFSSPTYGWNNVVKAGLTYAAISRDSPTQATVTLPAFVTYAPGANEVIQQTIDPSCLVLSNEAVVASPTFTVYYSLSDEPIYNSDDFTSLLFDDFSTYASVADMLAGTGAYEWGLTGPSHGSQGDYHTFTVGGGRTGGNAVIVRYSQQPGDPLPQSFNPGELIPYAGLSGYNPDVVILTQWVKNTSEDSFMGKLGLRKATSDWVSPHNANGPRLVMGAGNSPPQPRPDLTHCYWETSWPFDPLDPVNTPYYTNGQDRFTLVSSYQVPVYGHFSNTGYANYAEWAGVQDQQGLPNNNTYYRYTMRLSKGTLGQGRIEMWANGVKINDWDGSNVGKEEYELVYLPRLGTAEILLPHWYFFSEHKNSRIDSTFYLHLDETRIFTPK